MNDRTGNGAKIASIRGLIEDVADATLKPISMKSQDRMAGITPQGQIVGVWGSQLAPFSVETLETASFRLQQQATSFPALSRVLAVCRGLETLKREVQGCGECYSQKMQEGTPGRRYVAVQYPAKKRSIELIACCDCREGRRNQENTRQKLWIDVVNDIKAHRRDSGQEIAVFVTGSSYRYDSRDTRAISPNFYTLTRLEREGLWVAPPKYRKNNPFRKIVEAGPAAMGALLSEPPRFDPYRDD